MRMKFDVDDGRNSAFGLGPRKTTKNWVELAGRWTFRMHIDFYPAVRSSNTRILTAVSTWTYRCVLSLFKHLTRFDVHCHTYINICWRLA